jgi:FHA domain-containing protein
MIKCSECGYENMDGLDYCDGCGAKLSPTASPGAAAGGGSQAGAGAPAHEAAPPPAGEHPQAAPSGEAQAAEASQTPPSSEMQPVENSAGVSNANAAAAEEASRAPTGEIKPEPAAAPTAEPVGALTYKAKLAIIRGGRRGQEFELEPGNNLVGRWDPETGSFPEVDLDADDPEAKISRKHALIRLDGSKITIEDIGSLNGTYVNRQPRLQPGNPADLKDGDEIIIGKTFLKLSVNPIS